MMTDEIEPVSEMTSAVEEAGKPKSLLPLALVVGAVAAIILTLLTLI